MLIDLIFGVNTILNFKFLLIMTKLLLSNIIMLNNEFIKKKRFF